MFKPRQNPSAATATPPAIEVVRQRAKHRLIGASLLVLVGVVVFPVLFDTQPRPIPVDIPIEIPSRQAAKPASKAPTTPVETLGADKSLAQREEVVESVPKTVLVPAEPKLSAAPQQTGSGSIEQKPGPKAETKPDGKLDTKVEAKTEAKAESKPATPASVPAASASAKDAERAQALLEGRDVAQPAASVAAGKERFIVQVGAFSESALAQQVRLKLERAGLKTYTHVAETAEGKRIRVRLGPFASRAEADKAAAKAKGLGLAAAILTL